MKNDETSRLDDEAFEQRLRKQGIKRLPSAWRDEILSAAQAAVPRRSTLNPRPSLLSTLNHQLSTLLWPHPKAWAGLAAAWVVIFVLNFAGRDESQPMAKNSPPPSPEMMAALREQHRLLVELVGRTDLPEAERPRVVPSPRSERRDEILSA
jgi:hypothetical protein